MLIKADTDAPKVPSLKEVLAQQYADTELQLQKMRDPQHELLKDKQTRMGKAMPHNELVRILTKMNRKLFPEDSNADRKVVGLYYVQGKDKKFATAFRKGFVPEYTYINVDRADLMVPNIIESNDDPVGYVKGWRQVLVELFRKKLITLNNIRDAFGPQPGHNTRSNRYLSNISQSK